MVGDNKISVVSVEKLSNGTYMLNGTMNVPPDPGNLEYKEIMAWLAKGNKAKQIASIFDAVKEK